MKKLLLSYILFTLFLLFSCSDRINEKEPNDSFDDAEEIALDETVKAYIDTSTDSDYYRLQVDRELRAGISLSSLKGINHSITVYRDLGGKKPPVKLIDDSRKSSPEEFPDIGFFPGVYYICIAHGERDEPKGTREVAYRLRVSTVDTEDKAYEFEPNDQLKLATPVTPGVDVYGYYSPSFNKLNKSSGEEKYLEYDYYEFDLSRSSRRVVADISLSAVPGVDAVLKIYSPSGKLLNQVDSTAIGGGESLLGQGLPVQGTYYVEVTGKSYASNNEVPYTLLVALNSFDSSVEMEPNNTIEEANELSDEAIKGRIYPQGDEDYYSYIPEVPHFVDIDLASASSVNCRLTILNAKGEELVVADEGGEGIPEKVPSYFTGERLYVKVEGFSGQSDPEKYYLLALKNSMFQEDMEIEPNDTKERATYIEKNLIYGFSTTKDDKDYFLIEHEGKNELDFTITAPENAELVVNITDNLGYILNSYELSGEEPLVVHELVNKRAYLLIETKKANSAKPYMIEIAE